MLAALIVTASLTATPMSAEAGPLKEKVKEKLHSLKQSIQIDIKDAKCVLKKTACTFI